MVICALGQGQGANFRWKSTARPACLCCGSVDLWICGSVDPGPRVPKAVWQVWAPGQSLLQGMPRTGVRSGYTPTHRCVASWCCAGCLRPEAASRDFSSGHSSGSCQTLAGIVTATTARQPRPHSYGRGIWPSLVRYFLSSTYICSKPRQVSRYLGTRQCGVYAIPLLRPLWSHSTACKPCGFQILSAAPAQYVQCVQCILPSYFASLNSLSYQLPRSACPFLQEIAGAMRAVR